MMSDGYLKYYFLLIGETVKNNILDNQLPRGIYKSMKKEMSNDLKAVGEILQESFSSLESDKPISLEELKINFLKNLGENFNGDRLYISSDQELIDRTMLVRKYLSGNYSVREISKATGIPTTSVFRILKKISHCSA